MASKLNKEDSKNDALTSSCNAAEKRCNHLKYFKDFLVGLTKDAVTNEVDSETRKEADNLPSNGCNNVVEMRPLILTRSINETYTVTKDEICAEIIMCIWQWLCLKQCPEHFKIGVLFSAIGDIKTELKNRKIQEDLKASNCKQSVDISNVLILDLLKLQRFIHNQLEKILLRLSDNSKEENLQNFADCYRGNPPKYALPNYNNQYVEAHIKNKPRKMEDRHICLPHFSQIYQIDKFLSFYGIFDGHSGSLSATYATNQIPYLVAQNIKSASNSVSVDRDIYRDALESSFLQVDNNFGEKQLSSGTTAVCALLVKDAAQEFQHLYVAWVGDSRCLLVSPTVYLQLVKPHKPDLADEKKRIESAETGGSVLFVQGQWRVNGIINVSRSIGDYTVKAVIAEPDIVDVPLQPSHDFLVLGSDGLWDHVGEKEIVDCVYKSIVEDYQRLDDIPKHLIELAKQGDSQDNITVVLVLLKDVLQIKDSFLKSQKKTS